MSAQTILYEKANACDPITESQALQLYVVISIQNASAFPTTVIRYPFSVLRLKDIFQRHHLTVPDLQYFAFGAGGGG